MNVQEYISSGIVENYVMGLADETESAEFERMCELYPEVKAARDAYEMTLEETAMASAVEPPRYIKSKIFSEIEISEGFKSVAAPLPSTPEKGNWKNLKLMQYTAAAAILLFIITGIFALYLLNQFQDAKQQYQLCLASEKEIQSRLAVLQRETNTLREDLAVITNEDMIQVKLPGNTVPTSPAPESIVTVFWNKKTKAIFLVPNKIPRPAANKQYQLWVLVNGKPQDAGIFDIDSKEPVITMKRADSAEGFAVSLEDKGSNASTPSGEIYVMGKI